MQVLLNIIFIAMLLAIAYQDFKEREVSFLFFVFAALIGGYLHYTKQFFLVFLAYLLLNLSFIVVLLLILYLYTRLKMKKKFTEVMGAGDLVFFIVIGFSFPTLSFLVLFLSSLIFSLLFFLLLKPTLIKKTVPLAGLQSLFFTLVISINMMFNFIDLYKI